MQKSRVTSEPELLVTQANRLIESRHCLSVTEQRVVAMMVAAVSPDDEDFKPYPLKVSDLLDLLPSEKQGGLYERIEAAATSLLEKPLRIDEDDGPLWVNWLSSVKYYDGEGTVTLSFDPHLKPYLLQLKERFTSYGLENVVRLQSRYSIRIYELLKQYETIGKRTFELPDLRRKLALEDTEYKRWQDFKRWVITPAQRELPLKTDISFSYKTRRKCRKIWFLDFMIRPGKKAETPTKNELSRQKGEAAKCWSKTNGTCAAKWDDHQSPGDACHWCRKFETRRAEAAGQLPLLS